jgi:hypothetical protein
MVVGPAAGFNPERLRFFCRRAVQGQPMKGALWDQYTLGVILYEALTGARAGLSVLRA